jgi:hypothetical protein
MAQTLSAKAARRRGGGNMIDLLYIAGTLAFFALMLAYVAACARLGRSNDGETTDDAR